MTTITASVANTTADHPQQAVIDALAPLEKVCEIIQKESYTDPSTGEIRSIPFSEIDFTEYLHPISSPVDQTVSMLTDEENNGNHDGCALIRATRYVVNHLLEGKAKSLRMQVRYESSKNVELERLVELSDKSQMASNILAFIANTAKVQPATLKSIAILTQKPGFSINTLKSMAQSGGTEEIVQLLPVLKLLEGSQENSRTQICRCYGGR